MPNTLVNAVSLGFGQVGKVVGPIKAQGQPVGPVQATWCDLECACLTLCLVGTMARGARNEPRPALAIRARYPLRYRG